MAVRKKTNAFFEAIREGLEGTIEALEKGEPLTCRMVELPPPPVEMSSKEIAKLRKETLGVSQRIFAGLLNVAPQTVHAWEQGRNKPSGSSLRLLELAAANPETMTALLAHKHRRGTGKARRTVGLHRTTGRKRTTPRSKKPVAT